MKKTLALLLVASLLLAGCTELISSDEDDEVKKIEVNEDIAIEKINDFITVDEEESFGITMMYDMDPSMMDDGEMLEFDEDSDAMITIEMTEAWSPDGYHSSMVMGLTEDGATMKMTQTFTHVGTTIYTSMGYETIGDICANEDSPEETEACEMQVESIPATQFYSMEAANTHTDLIAAMAEETADNSEDMDPMAMLQFFNFVECFGVFTPADSVDGLQVFDVAMEGMDDDELTPEMALCVADADDSNSISFEEFQSVDDTDDEDVSIMQTFFDEADANSDEELTADELQGFIDAVDAHYESEDDDMDGEGDSDMMPAISVAFNDAGEIEYLEMGMDEMGDEIVTMKIYVLTEDRVASFFTDLEAGELVALPFELSDSMDGGSDDWDDDGDFYCNDGTTIPMDWVNDGDEDCAGGEDEMDMGGSDDEFMCDDGSTIPMDWVNDGDEDCAGGEDEMDMGESDDEFTCDDGVTIPMDYVNDGDEDCADGEDEGVVWVFAYDNCDPTGDLNSYDCWDNDWADADGNVDEFASYWDYECEQLTDGSWECTTDFVNYYDNCAYEGEDYYECWLDEWDTDDDGSYDLGSDGYMDSDCEQLADGRWACSHPDDDGEDNEGMLTPELVLELFDTDGDSMLSWDEFWNSYESGSADDEDALSLIFDENDDDMDGLLSEEELEDFILAVSAYEDGDEPTFICGNGEEIPFMFVNDGAEDCSDGADEQQYDSDGNEINWFDCMDGTQIWITDVNDGYPDCQDGDDEMPEMDDDHDGHDHDDHGDEDMVCYDMSTHTVDHTIDNEADCEAAGYMWTEDQSDDHDHGDHGDDSDEIVMYITSDMDFHFEGDISDYKIVLATCEEDYDSDTEEWITTCSTVVSVQIADATADSDIMFHDADGSETISVGDMIHIGETSEEWNTVRLYSVSADAYSDENPMLTVPGFTGLVGMLALLGAAFIRRNE